MKKYRLILMMALTAALAASLLSGCGKKRAADSSDTVVEAEAGDSEEDAAADSADDYEDEVEDNSEDIGDESLTPKEAYPDPDGLMAEDVEVTNESKSEGLNAVPGQPVELKDTALFGNIGETYSIPEENAHFTLTVNDISLTDRLTSDQEANRVVRLTYTYDNIDVEYLMIGQYSFKMLDADGNACQIYYFNPEGDDEVNMMPVEAGHAYRAALGFILPDGSDKCTIIYDDLTGISDVEITWEQTFD